MHRKKANAIKLYGLLGCTKLHDGATQPPILRIQGCLVGSHAPPRRNLVWSLQRLAVLREENGGLQDSRSRSSSPGLLIPFRALHRRSQDHWLKREVSLRTCVGNSGKRTDGGQYYSSMRFSLYIAAITTVDSPRTWPKVKSNISSLSLTPNVLRSSFYLGDSVPI
jgi:hypothetical protein